MDMTYIRKNFHANTQNTYTHTYIHEYMHANTHTHNRAEVQTYIRTYVQTYPRSNVIHSTNHEDTHPSPCPACHSFPSQMRSIVFALSPTAQRHLFQVVRYRGNSQNLYFKSSHVTLYCAKCCAVMCVCVCVCVRVRVCVQVHVCSV